MLHKAAVATQLVQANAGIANSFYQRLSENAKNAIAQVPGSHYRQKPYGPASLASTIREILESG
jgi:hypothetical protein